MSQDGFLDFDQIINGIEASDLGIDFSEDFFPEEDVPEDSFIVGRTPKKANYNRMDIESLTMADWNYYGDDER